MGKQRGHGNGFGGRGIVVGRGVVGGRGVVIIVGGGHGDPFKARSQESGARSQEVFVDICLKISFIN